jgi:predicted TIM-barrel fold metal-dependent hydrolase
VISADSHLELPVDRWMHRIPAQFRDRAPRRIKLPTGGDAHIGEGRDIMIEPKRMGDEYRVYPFGGSFDDNPGAGSAEQRVSEQDRDGVDAEILYPGSQGPNYWRGIKDDNAYKAIVHAYNEYVAEEYCSVAPHRLLGLGLIPETNVDDAIAELKYCARIGLRGVSLNAFPAGKMYPTPEDDKFWAAAVDMNMPLSVHVMFQFGGGGNYKGPLFKYDKQWDQEVFSAGKDIIGRYANYFTIRGARDAIRLVIAGVFDRFPTLKVYFAENEIGWIPNWLEQADNIYRRNHRWSEELLDVKPLKHLPSDYVKEHCYWGFQNNPIGVKLRHEIGVEHVMWSSDFPHTESDWPHSLDTIKTSFAGVPESEKYNMIAGNAIKYFHLSN